jgi:hypothetical protein
MATSKPPSATRIGELVRLSVLSWSATLLTASYAGILPKDGPDVYRINFYRQPCVVWH